MYCSSVREERKRLCRRGDQEKRHGHARENPEARGTLPTTTRGTPLVPTPKDLKMPMPTALARRADRSGLVPEKHHEDPTTQKFRAHCNSL